MVTFKFARCFQEQLGGIIKSKNKKHAKHPLQTNKKGVKGTTTSIGFSYEFHDDIIDSMEEFMRRSCITKCTKCIFVQNTMQCDIE